MIKKFLAVLAILTSTIVVSPAMTQNAAAASWTCQNKTDRWDHTFNPASGRSVYIQFTNAYRRCIAPDLTSFVEPNYAIGAYNVLGVSHMTCNAFDRYFDGMHFNAYYWRPYNGVSFNPGAFFLPCDESTQNAEVQNYDYDDVPRLYYGPGNGDDRQPRWKVNVTYARNFGHGFDMDASHWQKFQPSS